MTVNGKIWTWVLLVFIAIIAVMLFAGCATRVLEDPETGFRVKSSVPIWQTKSALGEFKTTIDMNGVRTVEVRNFSQENNQDLTELIRAVAAGVIAGMKASSGAP